MTSLSEVPFIQHDWILRQSFKTRKANSFKWWEQQTQNTYMHTQSLKTRCLLKKWTISWPMIRHSIPNKRGKIGRQNKIILLCSFELLTGLYTTFTIVLSEQLLVALIHICCIFQSWCWQLLCTEDSARRRSSGRHSTTVVVLIQNLPKDSNFKLQDQSRSMDVTYISFSAWSQIFVLLLHTVSFFFLVQGQRHSC